MTENRVPETGDVLSSEWVRERHAFEDATQAQMTELQAEVAELKQML